MYYNEVSVENEIILGIYAEKGPYNMTMWFVVHLIVTDTYVHENFDRHSDQFRRDFCWTGLNFSGLIICIQI